MTSLGHIVNYDRTGGNNNETVTVAIQAATYTYVCVICVFRIAPFTDRENFFP